MPNLIKTWARENLNFAVYACGLWFLLMQAVAQVEGVAESRFWRDFTQVTPFYDVVVYRSTVSPDSITVDGEMKKRRCDFADLHACTVTGDNPRLRAVLSTAAEDARGVVGNRTPSPDAEQWGPWAVLWPEIADVPSGWSIWAGHWCPVLDVDGAPIMLPSGDPRMKYEINLFASGPWGDVSEPVRQ